VLVSGFTEMLLFCYEFFLGCNVSPPPFASRSWQRRKLAEEEATRIFASVEENGKGTETSPVHCS